jgi:hypothetical protein
MASRTAVGRHPVWADLPLRRTRARRNGWRSRSAPQMDSRTSIRTGHGVLAVDTK